MHIIDELNAHYDRQAATTPSGGSRPVDPVVFTSGDCTWTLGMVLSMWAFVFERSSCEICERGLGF